MPGWKKENDFIIKNVLKNIGILKQGIKNVTTLFVTPPSRATKNVTLTNKINS